MQRLAARDLMTAEVVTVPPGAPVPAVARLLSERGISAVPVVDAGGALLGIVTEGDLIRRLAGEEDRPASWLAALFADPAQLAERYVRTHGVTAEEIMSRAVFTVEPGASAAHVAQLMEQHRVRPLVVVEGGRCGAASGYWRRTCRG